MRVWRGGFYPRRVLGQRKSLARFNKEPGVANTQRPLQLTWAIGFWRMGGCLKQENQMAKRVKGIRRFLRDSGATGES